jgi:hypothetical protein
MRARVVSGQDDRTVAVAVAAATGSGEPVAQNHGLIDLEAVGVQGGTGIVAQGRPGAVEVAADAGAGQADRAIFASARSGKPAAHQHVLIDLQAVRVHGGAGVVA